MKLQCLFSSQSHKTFSPLSPTDIHKNTITSSPSLRFARNLPLQNPLFLSYSRRLSSPMASFADSQLFSNGVQESLPLRLDDAELDHYTNVANSLADASGNVIRKYFRSKFDIVDKDDSRNYYFISGENEDSNNFEVAQSFQNEVSSGQLIGLCTDLNSSAYAGHFDGGLFQRNVGDQSREFIHGCGLMCPVTIADQIAEESMVSIIIENFPSHAIYGEEKGWRCKEKSSEYVWVLDPIDGTKSFITGKPVFGTLIALLHRGRPIIGIIDQPILKERWVGISGRETTMNGQLVSTRACMDLSQAYLYTTSPHLFSGKAEEAFARVRTKVKVPLYGCDCYAYALLASGYVDLVVESGLKPYDFLSLIPVIEGAGGTITDWKGHQLYWEATPNSHATSFNVVAAGDKGIHQQALVSLQWS